MCGVIVDGSKDIVISWVEASKLEDTELCGVIVDDMKDVIP